MKPATALALLALGIASIAAGAALQPENTAPIASTAQPVLPGIAGQLETAARVELHQGAKTSTLVRLDGKWGLAEREQYPVTVSKVRALFSGLGELRQIERRSSDATSWARLGVEDPAPPSSTATSLRVLDEQGKVLADIILGHRTTATKGDLPDHLYIRRPGDTQSWLAEGHLDVSADPQSWLLRDIVNIGHDSIARVVVQRGEDTFDFRRNGEAFALSNPPSGKLDDDRIAAMAGALELVSQSDVRRGPLPGMPFGNAVFTTTSGLSLIVTVNRDGKSVWASFAAHGPGEDEYQRLSGWAFELPEWRATSLIPAKSDLLATADETAPK